LHPVSQVPRLMTSQRTFHDVSSNRKSTIVPILRSLAPIAETLQRGNDLQHGLAP
jgi:hypothetical protein